MQRLYLFPARLYKHHVDDPESVNAPLLADILAMRGSPNTVWAAKPSPNRWEATDRSFGWRSAADAHLRTAFFPLAQEVEGAAAAVFAEEELAGRPRILHMWANVNDAGGYNMPHHHVFGMWSGVYYVQCPEGSPPIVLMAPHHMVHERHKLHAEPAEEGKMLFFPTRLIHYVPAHPGPEPRVSVFFNIALVTRGPEGEFVRCE